MVVSILLRVPNVYWEVSRRPLAVSRVRRGQKRLLRRLGSERDGTRAVGCIAAETSHGLHELRG